MWGGRTRSLQLPLQEQTAGERPRPPESEKGVVFGRRLAGWAGGYPVRGLCAPQALNTAFASVGRSDGDLARLKDISNREIHPVFMV